MSRPIRWVVGGMKEFGFQVIYESSEMIYGRVSDRIGDQIASR